ncbi:cytochrome b561 and DOMON domain-containing protein At4g17280-like [Rhododendron vialii]|uniref:cytochrome b561 and DOMON domain-containing protein At4g17280-like n=1 Tax=Rhododendron vialii TaxID=182163 RepID=UPI00265F31A0|nr:cytochrome b561 and DOMON domain-containing protein At4g17280-like [Rhododendron vialii]
MIMGTKSLTTLFISSLILSLSSAQTCNDYTFTSNKVFTTCTSLPYLSSFLHWTYHSNSTVDIAYRHTGVDTSTWVVWALNLESDKMVGAQSLVAYHNSSGSVIAHTSAVTSYRTDLSASSLSFDVPSISAEYVENVMVIYATLVLPSGQTEFNQVWQSGPVSGGNPAEHPTTGDNMASYGTVNFVNGQSTGSSGGGALQRRKNVHGILNAVSWGTLMPLGAMIARYLKVFKSADPAWFYLHVACQSSAYIVGVAGWATGLKLGSDSAGVTHSTHRNIGITLFALGTLQVFALLLRPKKDHKIRIYWNVYHWTVGYLTIILSIVNIFEGIDILNPGKNWKRAYISIIIFLGFNAAMLEAYTWYLVIKRKKTGSDKYPNGANGVTGYGNGTRSQQAV